ncbi:MAG: T9SS type A sorting domain-containing protein [Chitinophagaceae bacterium]|nr:T9SS type A sorting domain-containing protein [Chitinophagaceae bacterium]
MSSLGLLFVGKINFQDTSSLVISLTATVKDNSKVKISWKPGTIRSEFYSIERSVNGAAFETIGVIKQTSEAVIDWQDELPVAGKDQYRIRCTLGDGSQRYSATTSAIIAGNISFRFYPNPVDNVLIVRSENPVDIVIIDGNGKTRISQNQLSGLQMINVSSLEKGIYLIRVYNRYLNTQIQDRLVKN